MLEPTEGASAVAEFRAILASALLVGKSYTMQTEQVVKRIKEKGRVG